ncbi:MAG: two-component regulator propeller domain-containing protein [Bacteroidota bacterium]
MKHDAWPYPLTLFRPPFIPGVWLLLGCLLLLGSRARLWSQNFAYQHLSTEQGMTQNSVSAIVVDALGYMWIGTEDGLNRYDGEQLVNYQYLAANRKIHNITVQDLALGPEHQLYVLGNFALEQLSMSHDTSQLLVQLPADHPFNYVIADPQSGQALLKGPQFPGFIRPKSPPPITDRLYPVLAFDVASNQLYTATHSDTATIERRDLYGNLQYAFDNPKAQRLESIFAITGDQQILGGIQRNGQSYLARIKTSAEGITVQAQIALTEPMAKVFYQAEENRIYGLTYRGDIWVMDGALQLLKKLSSEEQSLYSNPKWFITDALIHQGHIWLGVDPFGLFFRSLGNNQFTSLSFLQEPPAIIKNLFTDTQNRLYAFVLNRGLEVFDPDGTLITADRNLPPPLRSPAIFAGFNGLEALGNDQFVLSGRNILGRFDVAKNTWEDYYHIVQAQMPQAQWSDQYLFYESLGPQSALIGCLGRVYDFELSSKQLALRFTLPSPVTHLLAEAQRIWIGTTTGLFNCWDGDCTPHPDFTGLIIKDVRRAENGTLLVATSTGLSIVEGEKLRVINQNAGLKNNYVYGSLTDDQGRIWVSTNQGLSRIDPQNWRVHNYDRADGLSATEFNSYGFWKAADGRLYFSGIGGITVVDPSADPVIPDAIPLVLSAWSINDRLPKPLPRDLPPIELEADQNTLTFHFRDLLLPREGNLLFQCQLEGFDEDWVQTDQLTIRYPQLPPGSYTFRLQLANAELPAMEQKLAFRIAQPFYQRAWFKLFLVLIAVGFILGVWYFYQNRQKAKIEAQQQRQRVLEEERKRISRELHDNMGAHTTALISNIQQLQRAESAQAHYPQLKRMQGDAEDILSSLRDTIWLLNDKKMYLTELVDLVKMFALRLLRNQSDYNLVVNENITEDVLLEAAQIVHLKGILQEIIHNTIKHAQGDCIVFNISSNEHLDLSLSDNGLGFDWEGQKEMGNGLQNIRWRVDELKGTLEVDSSESGTKYRILLSGH